MHDCPENEIDAELTLGAACANRLYLAIHQRLGSLARHPCPTVAVFDSELTPLYRNLAIVETAMWRHVAPHADAAETSAAAIEHHLGAEHPDVGAVIANAAQVSTALSKLTSLQRDAMLCKPLVALANNIAIDCQTEFDNENALARWRAQLMRAQQDVDSSPRMADLAGKGEDRLGG